MKVYRPGEDDTILSNRYVSDEDLQGLYSNRPIGQIPPKILQKKAKKRSGKDYQGILRGTPSFNKPQTWTLMKKDKRCAKCTGCKSIIESGNIYLHVDGALVTMSMLKNGHAISVPKGPAYEKLHHGLILCIPWWHLTPSTNQERKKFSLI